MVLPQVVLEILRKNCRGAIIAPPPILNRVKHKQCDVIGDLHTLNLREHDINNKGNITLLSQLSQT